MTKEEFVPLLKDYKQNRSKLSIKLKELKNKRYQLNSFITDTNITSTFGINQDIHSKNKVGDKIYKRVEQNDDIKHELEAEIIKLEKEVKKLRDKVETVDDRLEALKYKERQILIAYYIDGRSYEDIGTNLYWQLFKQTRNWETIKKIVEKATQKMLKL